MKGLLGVVVMFALALPAYAQTCVPRVQTFGPQHAFDARNNGRRVIVKQNFNHDVRNLQVQRQKLLLNQQYGNRFNQFNHGYNNNALVIQDKIVQFDHFNNVFAVPVTNLGLDYYYRVITEPERQRVADRIADSVLQRLAEQLRDADDRRPTPGPEPRPEPVPGPVDRPDPTPAPPSDDELTDRVFDILETNCAACHTQGDEKKIAIFDDIGDLLDLTADQKWKIWDRVDGSNLPRDKVMPKNGEPLSDEDVAILREWVRQ